MTTVLTFPGVTSREYGKNIVHLTRSDKKDPDTGFLEKLLPYNIRAIDFDSVKDDFDELRDSTGGNNKKLKSVDAFFEASSGTFYFIEFKNSPPESLDEIDEGEKIGESFRRKAFDSITLSGLTTTQNVTGSKLMKNAVLIVVYKSSAEDALSALDFNKSLTSRSNGGGSAIKYPIQWGLDDLKVKGLYSDVHTWPDNYFEPWAASNLK